MAVELARALNVEKRCGVDVIAVKGATCTFESGVIHAVCGENGAGKTTLLKMVAGMSVPDKGRIEVGGSILAPHTPREAIARGVAMVLQHFALIPVFTVLENLVLGAEPTGPVGMLDVDAARRRAERVAQELGVSLALDQRVESLGIGDRQRLEIMRALFRDAKLLILDEPTAVLTKVEAASLYATLRRLASAGKGIVVVTHKMDEVREHADYVTVLRRGELVFTRALDRSGQAVPIATQVDDVTAAIMGAGRAGARSTRSAVQVASEAPVVLDVKNVRAGPLDDVSLTVRAGEIVGIAGVEGNGQRELLELVAGDFEPVGGAIEHGRVAVIREDRQTEGLVLDASLRDNLVLGELGSFTRRAGLLDLEAIEKEASARLARSGANAGLDREARTLSGGNQQKIVVARALAQLDEGRAERRVLVAAHPTRGIDLAASEDVHARLRDAALRGAGVLVISSDLTELRALAHRLLVLARGRIVAELPVTASDEEIGRQMLGVAHAGEA
ncbi:Nucleoside ABC transporter, ATP-binding protein [Labilithrix luteola]|uniref:Nucleoside ABC transporter, ATP-binding protein n=1 Tax=Labilithrix luteola TaxID=1391654 RepID=A0A0K1Q8Z1_9BACT|nr:ATP-binding cassette domain-containing protein [Labilithrix luteola]AKV02147.1 Nucleoside ABC transporter, ATP-binding protein [Labilithrix luteola]